MTYLVTIISLTPDTRLTEKREAFSMTLMVCVICVETLSRMRWSRPAGDSRLDDDVVACDGSLDDDIAAVGTLQPQQPPWPPPPANAIRCGCQQGAHPGAEPPDASQAQEDYRKSLGTRAGRTRRPRAGRYRLSRPFPGQIHGAMDFRLDSVEQLYFRSLVSRCRPLEVLHRSCRPLD